MQSITIISSSVRIGKKSTRVAVYLKKYIEENYPVQVSMIDLTQYNFPIFEERLKFIQNPTQEMLALSENIKSANGIIIVTPEYNGAIPSSLKNVLDLLYDEWYRKPVAISSVSSGAFGGVNAFQGLLMTLIKLRTFIVPANFMIPMIDKAFNDNGQPLDPETTNKRAASFIKELMFLMEKLN